MPISALYDQFSGGRTDPARSATSSAPPIRLGAEAGVRDVPRRRLLRLQEPDRPAPPASRATLVPSFENSYDQYVARQFATDDWLLNVTRRPGGAGLLRGPDPRGGRRHGADVVRNKVLLYERTAPFGEYRNRVMLIADDNEQGGRHDRFHWGHLEQTSELDRSDALAHRSGYVYLHTYPDESRGDKPEAMRPRSGT